MNRTESPQIDTHIFGRLIFDKVAKAIQGGNRLLFNK